MINDTLDNIIKLLDRRSVEFGRAIRNGAPAHALETKLLAEIDGDASIAMEQYGDGLLAIGKPRKAGDAYSAAQQLAGGIKDLVRWKGLQAKIVSAAEADWERIKRELGYEPAEDQALPTFLQNRDWGYDPFTTPLR